MSLSFVEVSPAVMLFGAYSYMGYGTFFKNGQVPWQVPAAMSAGFWGYSVYTLVQEGLATVWTNHTQNLWGNQVWFDLLYSVSIYWFALLPRAKKLGMPITPWLLYNAATASIGGLHLFARILYLEEKAAKEGSSDVPTSYTSLHGSDKVGK